LKPQFRFEKCDLMTNVIDQIPKFKSMSNVKISLSKIYFPFVCLHKTGIPNFLVFI